MTETATINDLRQDDHNANTGTDRGREMVRQSLQDYGAGRSVLLDRNNRIIAGNKTVEAAAAAGMNEVLIVETTGDQIVAVKRTDLDLNDPRVRELAIADNRTAEVGLQWDPAALEQLQAAGVNLEQFWGEDELSDVLAGLQATGPTIGAAVATVDPEAAGRTLAERFLVPPFSVLDARQGYWQERKRAWLALGIESELGRDSGKANRGLTFSSSSQPPDVYAAKNRYEAERGRPVSWPEYFEANPGAERMTGTSIFDPVLCELAYRWFAPAGARILDPFAGGSVRGIVAARLGHAYTGIDLRAEQIAANEEQAAAICGEIKPTWICGDSMSAADLAPAEYDFLFSCPPYGDLEVYSDDPSDLSTMGYPEFLLAYSGIIAQCAGMLADDRFAVWVVGDFRDKKGFYRNFVSETIEAFGDAGMMLYNEAILVTQAASLPIRVGGQFGRHRKLGRQHQTVLVFYKGDPKRIPDVLGEVEVDEEAFAGLIGVAPDTASAAPDAAGT